MKKSAIVELDRRQAEFLKASAKKLLEKEEGFASARVHQGEAFRFLESAGAFYDVIFIDPPYALNLQDEAIERAVKRLSASGVLYVERAGSLSDPQMLAARGIVRLRSTTAGQVACELLGRADGPLAGLAKAEKPLRGKAAKIAAKQALKKLQEGMEND